MDPSKPTIRENYQEFERLRLSPNASLSSQTRGREHPEPECNIRTPFQRDRDRILHSKSFRRLKRKTQVFIAPLGDHYRTRLTHTLEVSQIGRTIARALQMNEDLVEAIVMGHDLGHTPFGHVGEAVLDELLSDGFRHYLQSLRVVDKIERQGQGLNLTWEVRDGILRHSKGMGAIFAESANKQPSTLEGHIVRAADVIAYVNHDLDDALRSGLVQAREIPRLPLEALGQTHSQRINSLVTDVIEASSEGNPQVIRMSPEKLQHLMGLRTFLDDRVYRHPGPKREFLKARKLLMGLYEYVMGHPDEYLSPVTREQESDQRAAADFIAGMTDNFAIALHHHLFVPQEWVSGAELKYYP